MDTLDGSIVHIILLLLFIGFLIHFIHQERHMCGVAIVSKTNFILIEIHNEVKSNNKFSKILLLLKSFPSLFSIAQILRIAVHTVDWTASLPVHLSPSFAI